MKTLTIARDLKLPIDAVTQTIAILAKRRAGKSYTMRRFAEQLFAAGQQIVLVDPKGDQWGIRSAADGKGPGLPVVILGGERGDVPLEASSGEIVAKLVVEERVSILLDLSLFRKHEVATFMTAFLENLYRLKAKEIYRTPVMLVIDEADAVAPQKPQKGEERMLGAAEDIVRRGGQRGIGCVLVTQRSAVLNKNVLTQAQMLVALRTIAPQDLAAMDAWIQVHGTPEQRKTLMESLPSLPVGDAWFWSPGWPTVEGIFKRVHVLPIETFDSGATPKPGEKRAEPKSAADVDLEALKRQMAATIEKAKADDPRELKKQLAEQAREIARLTKGAANDASRNTRQAEPKVVEKKVIGPKEVARLEGAGKRYEAAAGKIEQSLAALNKNVAEGERVAREIRQLLAPAPEAIVHSPRLALRPQTETAARQVAATGSNSRAVRPPSAPVADGDVRLERLAERKIIAVLAQYPQGRTVKQTAILSGYAMNGGGFRNAVGKLKSLGLIDSPRPGELVINDAGLPHAAGVESLPTGQELQQHWMGQLDRLAEREVLRVLLEAYPSALTAEEIASRTRSEKDVPYEANGGGFRNAIGKLRTLELIQGRGEIKASEEFFS